MPDRIRPAQIRGARGMLGWSMLDLAKAAKLSVSTVKRLEAAIPQPISEDASDMVRAAFETAGICFLDDVSEGFGMRFQLRISSQQPVARRDGTDHPHL